MKPPPLRYVRPDGLDEALAVLAEHGDEAKVLAGGCSLVPMLNMRLARPEVLVDVNRIEGLADVRAGNGTVATGAMLRQSALERSPSLRGALPLAAACAPYIGHFVTRNRGTVGGSVAHADARGELPLALLTLGGSVLAQSQRGRRSIAAEDLFLYHFTSALEPDELLTEVRWPAAGPGWGYGFAELAQRHGDYALAMAACALRRRDGVVAEARLGLGAVADRRRTVRGSARLGRLPASPGGTAQQAGDPPGLGGRGCSCGGERVVSALAEVAVTVNGRRYREPVPDRLLLSDFLRHRLGLTGTHVGCEHGVCGSCTVHLDGTAVRSCLLLAVQTDGAAVHTVESLADGDRLHPLQEAFREQFALQCGFCTPGILMAALDFLAHNPAPTRREIAEMLSGHLCRCTGYAPIIDAIASAAAGQAG